jgi:hypothetical protein
MTSSSSNTVGGGGGGDGASTNGHVGNVEKHPRTDVTGDEEKGEVRNSDKRQRVSRELDVGSDRVTRMEPVKYSDCVLTIGGSDMRAARHTYCCHRAVLARSSAHLATLFESGETNVHLGDGLVVPIEPVTFSIFVRLLYDADLHDTLITAENVRVLCELAHYMDAATITRWCEFQLMRTHEKRRGPALISVISTNSDRSGHKYHIGSYVVALWKCNNSYSCFVLGHNTDLTYAPGFFSPLHHSFFSLSLLLLFPPPPPKKPHTLRRAMLTIPFLKSILAIFLLSPHSCLGINCCIPTAMWTRECPNLRSREQ